MVKNEYLRFLEFLKAEGASPNVYKIANLILNYFDDVLQLGTAQGRRAKKTTELAQKDWNNLSSVISDVVNETSDEDDIINRLKSIKIGPFRGFAKEECIDLNSLRVLVYGPNGTGKSSFCEAIEYGLLGSVEEAQSKRFKNQQDYLKNAHINRFVAPVIDAINSEDETITILPNETLYRFCFVEKNRIDNFSRIAAHTPARQTELISSLFGLEGFNEFVKNFSREIDERHIDLVGKKGSQLKEKQLALEVHKTTIENNKKSLVTQTEDEAKLAQQFKHEITFPQFVQALGTDENPGEIQELEVELQKKQSPITNLTAKVLGERKIAVESIHRKLTSKLSELSKASEGLSFKQLYGAVLDLEKVSEDKCPACKTPLAQVTQNPYGLATTELAKLSHLAQLEQERDQLQIDFCKAVKSVHEMVKTCVDQIDIENNPLRLYLVEDEKSLDWDWWQNLELDSEAVDSPWLLLKNQVQKLEQRDRKVITANEGRDSKQIRLA